MMKPKNQENEPLEEPRYVDISLSEEEDTDWAKDETDMPAGQTKPWMNNESASPTEDDDERKQEAAPPPARSDKRLYSRKNFSSGEKYKPAGNARKAPVNKEKSKPTNQKTPKLSRQFPQLGKSSAAKPYKPVVKKTVRPAIPAKMLPAQVGTSDNAKIDKPVQENKIITTSLKRKTVETETKNSQPKVTVSTETLLPEWYVLEDIIAKHTSLPLGSVILGIDEVGKPLVISLDDYSFGSLLFMGDSAPANRKHLQSVLASAEALNQPELLQIDVITPTPAGYASKSSNLRKICDVSDECIYNLLGDYLTTVEQRLRDERQLPFQLLVLDQVETLAERLAEESLRFLRWIIRRGPQVGIWPLASIDSESLVDFDLKTYKSFGFHLYGKMTVANTVNRFTRIPPKLLRALSPGSQGCFMLEEDVVSFSIPEVAQ